MMRLPDITGLICLWCVLMFFSVNSQLSNCGTGWFGARCSYRCRCTNDSCDGKGLCVGTAVCQGGWFGPACQYAEVAYYTQNLPAITDDNDSTCIDSPGNESLKLTLNHPIIFTWLRVRAGDKVIDALKSLSLTFASNTTAVICADLKTQVVDKWTLDIHCNLTEPINSVNVTGRATTNLCSVYISGGRNVALKQRAVQERPNSTTAQNVPTTSTASGSTPTASPRPDVSFPAELAVDGRTVEDSRAGPTCSQSLGAQTWTVSFLQTRRVHRYVIHNRRDESAKRLIGFTLQSFNSQNVSVFRYEDSSTDAAYNYTLIHPPQLVMTVQVTTNNMDRIIQLCEVEVYGDSVCSGDKYGLECEHSCKCLPSEACFVSTGGCPSGCPHGFHGAGCLSNCSDGAIGENCQAECSRNCAPTGDLGVSACNSTTGACVKGCQPGFSGVLCKDDCPVGMFGHECKTACSTTCAPPKDATKSPCDHVNGTCIYGCTTGFSGPLCADSMQCLAFFDTL